MGYAMDPPPPAATHVSDPGHVLQRIFSYDSTALDSLWAAVGEGKVRCGISAVGTQRK